MRLVPVVGNRVWYCSVLGWLPKLVLMMRAGRGDGTVDVCEMGVADGLRKRLHGLGNAEQHAVGLAGVADRDLRVEGHIMKVFRRGATVTVGAEGADHMRAVPVVVGRVESARNGADINTGVAARAELRMRCEVTGVDSADQHTRTAVTLRVGVFGADRAQPQSRRNSAVRQLAGTPSVPGSPG